MCVQSLFYLYHYILQYKVVFHNLQAVHKFNSSSLGPYSQKPFNCCWVIFQIKKNSSYY